MDLTVVRGCLRSSTLKAIWLPECLGCGPCSLVCPVVWLAVRGGWSWLEWRDHAPRDRDSRRRSGPREAGAPSASSTSRIGALVGCEPPEPSSLEIGSRCPRRMFSESMDTMRELAEGHALSEDLGTVMPPNRIIGSTRRATAAHSTASAPAQGGIWWSRPPDDWSLEALWTSVGVAWHAVEDQWLLDQEPEVLSFAGPTLGDGSAHTTGDPSAQARPRRRPTARSNLPGR